ncbi:MAG: universal stress protein [Pseudomonadota bacterium]
MTGRILVAIDLRDENTSAKVLETALRQASHESAPLTVMTVVPDIFAGLDYHFAVRGQRKAGDEYDIKAIVQNAHNHLDAFVAKHAPRGVEPETVTRHGTIYEEILNVAEGIGADQIVIGAHRPNLADYLLGPNTARVVHQAKCSVNVVRSQ